MIKMHSKSSLFLCDFKKKYRSLLYSIGYGFLFLVIFFVSLVEMHLLGEMMIEKKYPFYYLQQFLAMVTFRFLLGVLLLHIQGCILKQMQERWLAHFKEKFLKNIDSADFLFRNVDLYVENSLLSLDFFLGLISICLSFFCFLYFFSWHIIFIFLILIPFLPLLVFLSRKANDFYATAQRLTKIRMRIISKMLEHRVVILSTYLIDNSYNRLLKKIFQKELKFRNLDSVLRSLDIYIDVFFKFLPSLMLGRCLVVFYPDSQVSPVAIDKISDIFWMSLPIFSQMLRLPQGFVAFHASQRAKKFILSSFQPWPKVDLATISCDKLSEVWCGSLKDNILAESDLVFYDLITATNLYDEVGDEKVIEVCGENISAGQRLRILVLRALALGLRLKTSVVIDLVFDSLDAENCNRILELVYRMRAQIPIKLSDQATLSLYRMVNKVSRVERNSLLKVKNLPKPKSVTLENFQQQVLKNLFTDINPWIFIFLGAAIVNGFLFDILGQGAVAFHDVLIFLSFLGLGMTTFGGYKIESMMRKKAFFNVTRSLTNKWVLRKKLDTLCSVELSSVCEKLSLYAHDLAWLLALLCIAIFSMQMGFFGMNLVAMSVFFVGFFLNYKIIGKKILSFRRNYVHSCKDLINGLHSQMVMDRHPWFAVALDLRTNLFCKTIFYPTCHWFKQKFVMFYWRSLSALVAQLNVNVTIGVLLLSFFIFPVEPSIKAIILGCFVSVGYASVGFFAAFSGYAAQLQPKLDLEACANLNFAYVDPLFLAEHYIYIAPFTVKNLNATTKPITFLFRVIKLDGNSGIGKTSVMKSLVGLSPSLSGMKIAYIPHRGFKLLGLLRVECDPWDHLEALCNQGVRMFLLDEAFLDCSVDFVLAFFRQAEGFCEEHKVTILFVDHRVAWQFSMKLSDWML